LEVLFVLGSFKMTEKKKYYPELNVSINQGNDGITFHRSKPVIESNDSRYMLVTSLI
jgi:hypothetical protein